MDTTLRSPPPVACEFGGRTGPGALLELFTLLRDGLAARHLHLKDAQPVHRDFRAGDVLHSPADVGKAQRLLGYEPTHTIGLGLAESLGWYEGQGRG